MNSLETIESQSNSIKNFSHIRKAIIGQPIAITESGLDLILGIVEAHERGLVPPDMKSDDPEDAEEQGSPHLQMVGNVAVISVMGPIMPRAQWFHNLSNISSSTGVMTAIDEAKAQKPSAYVFLFDSPGGSVSLGFECANKIFSLRGGKAPVVSVVQGTCCSLAYLFASQAETIFCGVDSMVGSISVVMRSMTNDRMMRNAGIDFFTMKSGDLKQMDDPSFLATSKQYESLLAQLGTWHDLFKSSVRRGRPMMDIEKVSTGEIWIGQKAVAAGLADEVSTLDDVLNSLGA